MRRGEEAGFAAGVTIDRFEHRAGRTFTVGASNVDEFELVLWTSGEFGEFERAFEAEICAELLELIKVFDRFLVTHERLLADRNEIFAQTIIKRPVRQCGTRHARFAHLRLAHYRESWACRHNVNRSGLARKIKVPSVGHRRGGEALAAAAEAFAVGDLAGLRVKAGQNAVVETAIQIIADSNRSLHVIALAQLHPGYRRVRVAEFRWSNIPFGVEMNCANYSRAVCARKITQSMRNDWSWNWNIAAAVEFPNFFASLEVIAARVMPAIDQNLRLIANARDCRRAPGRNIFTWRAPNFFSVFEIEESEKGVGLHVTLNNNFAFVNDR